MFMDQNWSIFSIAVGQKWEQLTQDNSRFFEEKTVPAIWMLEAHSFLASGHRLMTSGSTLTILAKSTFALVF